MKKISLSLLLLSFVCLWSASGATFYGNIRDTVGGSYRVDPILTPDPDYFPQSVGTGIVLPVTRRARTDANGNFGFTNVVGGVYRVEFGSLASVLTPVPSDTNTYTFTELANLGTFDYPNEWSHISTRVRPGSGVTIETNAAGTALEFIELSTDWSSSGAVSETNNFIGALNVFAFGASTNAGFDNSTAFQAALNAASNYNGIVYVPFGRFTLSNTLVIAPHVTLKGVGGDRSILIWQGVGAMLNVMRDTRVEGISTRGSYEWWYSTNRTLAGNYFIKPHVTIDGSTTNYPYHIWVKDCMIDGFDVGAYLDYTWIWTFEDNIISHCRVGILGTNANVNAIHVIGGEITTCTNAIKYYGGGASWSEGLSVRGVTIQGCYENGIITDSTCNLRNLSIKGCYFENSLETNSVFLNLQSVFGGYAGNNSFSAAVGSTNVWLRSCTNVFLAHGEQVYATTTVSMDANCLRCGILYDNDSRLNLTNIAGSDTVLMGVKDGTVYKWIFPRLESAGTLMARSNIFSSYIWNTNTVISKELQSTYDWTDDNCSTGRFTFGSGHAWAQITKDGYGMSLGTYHGSALQRDFNLDNSGNVWAGWYDFTNDFSMGVATRYSGSTNLFGLKNDSTVSEIVFPWEGRHGIAMAEMSVTNNRSQTYASDFKLRTKGGGNVWNPYFTAKGDGTFNFGSNVVVEGSISSTGQTNIPGSFSLSLNGTNLFGFNGTNGYGDGSGFSNFPPSAVNGLVVPTNTATAGQVAVMTSESTAAYGGQPVSLLSANNLDLGVFTNIVCGRIAILGTNGVTYYITLSTNAP